MRRGIAVRLAVALGSLTLAILCAETAVRVLLPEVREYALPQRLVRSDPRLGWRLAPNMRVVHRSRYFEVTYATDAAGYRDHAHAGSGRHSVLLLGDSQVFGWGVPLGKRFSDRLGDRLAGVRIHNHAIPGYGLDQQVLAWQLDDLRPRATHVLLWASQATLYRITTRYQYGRSKPTFRLTHGGGHAFVPPAMRLDRAALLGVFDGSYLAHAIDHAVGAWDDRMRGIRTHHEMGGAPGALMAGLLDVAAALAAKRGQLLAVLTPIPEGAQREALGTACRAVGAPLLTGAVDSAPGFIQGPRDLHWTSRAHEAIAAQLQPQLERWLATPRPKP